MKNGLQHCPVVILAGGASRRMGGPDKAEVTIGGERLIARVHDRLTAQAGEILISGRHDYGLPSRVIVDRNDGPGGPAAGIHAAWSECRSAIEGIFTAAVDGPDVPLDLCERLYSPDHSSVARDGERLHPVYAWWRMVDVSAFFADWDMDQSLSLHRLTDATSAKAVLWDEPSPFFNINRREDLARYRER